MSAQEARDRLAEAEPLLNAPIIADVGVPGVTVVHFPTEYTTNDGLPVDGRWSPTWTATNLQLSRARFRTLHAAANYALRVRAIEGALAAIEAQASGGPKITKALTEQLRHAEAHAHEVDAVYPVRSVIPMQNGPSLVYDSGNLRRYLSNAPSLKWIESEAGLACDVCGEPPVVEYDR
jgi:hypothetical protein